MIPVMALRRIVYLSVVCALSCAVLVPISLFAQTEGPTATVVAAGLNVRSGPGVSYARVATVTKGTVLTVIGQTQNCGWLKVELADGSEGWVSGGARYTLLDGACSAIPTAAAGGVAPQAAPTSSGGNATRPAATPTRTTPAAMPTAAPTPRPTTPPPPTPTPLPPADDNPLPPDQACYLLENFVGPELTVTFTNQDSGKITEFRVPPSGQYVSCISPGSYTATVDAPPPWNTINFEFRANAGDRARMPFYGSND